MKKIIICLFAVCSLITANSLFAQDAATTKGNWLVDFGVGFVGGDYNGYNPGNYGGTNWKYTTKAQVPTLSVSVQKAFWDDITIGGQIAFNVFGSKIDLHQSDGYYQHSKYSQSNIYFLGRGEYHFNRLIGLDKKYDLYAGVLAGSRISTSRESQIYEGWGTGQPGTWRNDYPNKTSTSVGPDGGIFGGFRYYFKGNMSVYAEAGFGITALRAGLAWKL